LQPNSVVIRFEDTGVGISSPDDDEEDEGDDGGGGIEPEDMPHP
jgi:hypothetical protein